MTNPFEPPALPTPPVVAHPIALVAETQDQIDVYLSHGQPPGAWVPVFEVEDVPERIGGMAILRETAMPEDLMAALVAALNVGGAAAP